MDIRQYYSIINYRTYLALGISVVVTYVFYKFDFTFNLDLTLLSIAIIFPLVFAIRTSFKRREKALEHLSEFRSSLKTLYYFFNSNDKLSEEDLKEIKGILSEINTVTLNNLKSKDFVVKDFDAVLNKVFQFTRDKSVIIPRNLREKVFRFMKDLHESVENVFAIHTHRTPISLKAYCEIFIYIFPFLYVPTIIYNIGIENSQSIVYSIVQLTQFILISLYNIQNQLEYPFDNIGLDDIKLDGFMIER